MINSTALQNHNRIVYEEMSSWTSLTWYIGMKTEFLRLNLSMQKCSDFYYDGF